MFSVYLGACRAELLIMIPDQATTRAVANKYLLCGGRIDLDMLYSNAFESKLQDTGAAIQVAGHQTLCIRPVGRL